jgi:hypothetical protein
VVEPEKFVRLGTRALDVSTDGLFLMTEVDVPLGTPVIVTFQIPGTECWVDAEGHVARVAHGRRMGDFAMGLGIAFDFVDEWSLTQLRMALRKVPPVLPGVLGSSARRSARAPADLAMHA